MAELSVVNLALNPNGTLVRIQKRKCDNIKKLEMMATICIGRTLLLNIILLN